MALFLSKGRSLGRREEHLPIIIKDDVSLTLTSSLGIINSSSALIVVVVGVLTQCGVRPGRGKSLAILLELLIQFS